MSGCYIMVDNIVIYYEHWIFKYWPMKNYTGITLTSNIILFKPKKENIGQRLMNHEAAGHWTQYALMDSAAIQTEIDGVMVFWLSYGFFYLWNRVVKGMSHREAYKNIWQEKAARDMANV